MFRIGRPADHPLRIRPELLRRGTATGPFPVLHERTPVRMDLTHTCWSDIFFLGMDYPNGANVLNVSVDLCVHGRGAVPAPPIDVFFRVIDEPVLRLVSVDLGATTTITTLEEVFDFARDYLGLLKAGVIASGLVPPGLEGSRGNFVDLLSLLSGPGNGVEIVSRVNNIPKGSRLAVSTNLLAAVISACMRATGQTRSPAGTLTEDERRLVAARAILGEWLGGSGGGWQDSGGVWPGIKLIRGARAAEGDPEFNVSRGRLLPRHELLGPDHVTPEARRNLEESLVLVHGGMAQNVGPILEMVTEKYLLRSEAEWTARQEALGLFDHVVAKLQAGAVRDLARATTRNFEGPIQAIIPEATNHFTESLITAVRGHFAEDFWGFWMLGGMSGGGMGFIVAPHRKAEAQAFLLETMTGLQQSLRARLPFAMAPVVYDFAVNPFGTTATVQAGDDMLLPKEYYALVLPGLLRRDRVSVSAGTRQELERLGSAARVDPDLAGIVEMLFDRMIPATAVDPDLAGIVEMLFDRMIPATAQAATHRQGELERLLDANGFDRGEHERIRVDLRRGLIGLSHNRLPAATVVEDVTGGDVFDGRTAAVKDFEAVGREALTGGRVAVVTLAAGTGSRWTHGAGVVKALHPFTKMAGVHRTFLDIHLAKSRRTRRIHGVPVPHVFTTGFLTHEPMAEYLAGTKDDVRLSRGRAVGLRLIPMVRDLRFGWEEMTHQVLDEQKEKVQESLRNALIGWALGAGEGADYTDNEPLQCLHPLGHWYEVPSLLRNGTLATMVAERPGLKTLLVHNIDTLGADLDPSILGYHLMSGRTLTFEMIRRRIDDRGGGLARVNGRLRILEGLALPREEVEWGLSYYNTLTTWVDIDGLLAALQLTRDNLKNPALVSSALSRMAATLPTYVTLKDVKRRWGQGQEDVYPVCQFEKLWGDMTALPDLSCGFIAVPRVRGQQLKDPAQLDAWHRDGSKVQIENLCEWS
jgi:hypothetical protein